MIPKKLTAEKSMGMSFFAACPLTGGLSVPRKSGSACALLIGHETKKDIPMLFSIVSFIYNPEAKRRGYLLGIKSDFIVDIKAFLPLLPIAYKPTP